MNVLGIETSCDETSAAVVRDGTQVLSSIVFSQVAEHRPYGGGAASCTGKRYVQHPGHHHRTGNQDRLYPLEPLAFGTVQNDAAGQNWQVASEGMNFSMSSSKEPSSRIR